MPKHKKTGNDVFQMFIKNNFFSYKIYSNQAKKGALLSKNFGSGYTQSIMP